VQRRFFVLSSTAMAVVASSRSSLAHHGWSSFDESRPLYISGRIKAVKWQNPHAELIVTVPADTSLPADLGRRTVPAQTSPVDGPRILAAAALPRKRGDWTLELSPMIRIDAWKVPEPKVGDSIAAVAFSFKDEKGEAFARVEYLFVGDRIFGLRSSPA